ncbi:MAG: DUF4870 domain-containing protein [Acidimicrobiia bacterium]
MSLDCPSCGTPAAASDARHCHSCGAALDPASPAEEGPVVPHPVADVTPAATSPAAPSGEARNWAVAAHLSAILGAWVALAFVGPLVVWLMKRQSDPFIELHAREALNFNLTLLIYLAVAFLLALVLIGFLLLAIIGVTWLILTIVAAVKASNGQAYRYPLTIRFVS